MKKYKLVSKIYLISYQLIHLNLKLVGMWSLRRYLMELKSVASIETKP